MKELDPGNLIKLIFLSNGERKQNPSGAMINVLVAQLINSLMQCSMRFLNVMPQFLLSAG